ncbi:MAG: transglutaminase family protein [Phycisphaeraceae bacterium]
MKLRVQHTTTYDYDEPASTSHNQVHLALRDLPWQKCLQRELHVTPAPEDIAEHVDYFGNIATSFAILEPHPQLKVHASSVIEVHKRPAINLLQSPAWEKVPQLNESSLAPEAIDAIQYRFDSPFIRRSPALAEYARPSFAASRPLLAAAMDLTQRIKRDFKYTPKVTTIATSIEEVLRSRHGVCQDFSHLQIGCLRSLGLPARYVSGYLDTDPPPGKPKLLGADASHAWISVYCPKTGWVDFDPTNGIQPAGRHVTICWGRDYGDVSPIRGVVLGGGDPKLTVEVDVRPV